MKQWIAWVAVFVALSWIGFVPNADAQEDGHGIAEGLRYEVSGSGEPVLLIHGSFFEEALVPLMNEPALEPYRRIRYDRRGYGESIGYDGNFSFEREAADALAILRHLNLDSAHVVGYSLGGVIAFEMARTAPEAIRSLTLIEPPLPLVGLIEEGPPPFIIESAGRYGQGDAEGAADVFMSAISRPNWRETLEGALPGAAESQVHRNAPHFFERELPGLAEYRVDKEMAARVSQPVLYVISSDASRSSERYERFHVDRMERFRSWVPQTDGLVIRGADHLVPLQEPARIAEGLARTIDRATLGLRSNRFRTSDGVELRYVEGGAGSPIVFVPGWTAPAWVWEAQLHHFAATHHVVALAPRGQGQSDRPAHGYQPARRAADVCELLEHLDRDPVVLVGWSIAVQEVLLCAHEFGTERIQSIVLVDYPIAFDPALFGMEERFRSLQLDRESWTRSFVDAIHANPPSQAYLDALTDAALSMPTNAAAIVIANILHIGPNDLSFILDSIDRPVMFVASSSPWAIEQAELVRERWPEIRVEMIADSAHTLFVDQPEAFNRVLQAFADESREHVAPERRSTPR